LDGGGAERNIVWLAGALAAAGGYSITLLTIRPDIADFYPVPSGVVRIKTPVEAANICRWFGWSCVQRRNRALAVAIQNTRPDVIISFIDTTNISVLMALGKHCDTPVIVAERVDPRRHRIGYRWSVLRSFYYPRAAAVVVQTKTVAEWAQMLWPRWKVATIPNPVPPPALRNGDRPEWFGPKNIISMGRLVEQKGFDLLIDAFGSLAPHFPDWHLSIIGEGQQRPHLSKRARAWAIGDRVHLVGTVRDPQRVVQHADLFVLSSRFEGFPNALCEAMACGLAVISFDCPSGPAEIIRNGVNGLLVPAGNVEALRSGMLALMKDAAQRRRFGDEARNITDYYSEPRVLGQWEELLQSISGGISS
jgi:glycosyltransferase involved in cell wall biosynthesis